MSEKVYIGMAKSIETKYGKMLKVSIHQEDVAKLVEEASQNNGWVNLALKERREPSERGWTHFFEVDRWKPDTANATVADDDDLPF